jgi:KDO2-lipid IV(A) lauroyltransferase
MTAATSTTGRAPGLRDRREGGAWTRAQALKNGAIYAVIRVALAVLTPLPPAMLQWIGRGLGLVALVAFVRARRVAYANVGCALPHLTPAQRRAVVLRAYVTLGAHLGDAFATLHPRRPVPPLALGAEALAAFDDARAAGRGVVFASAHLGPWERVAASLVARGVPLTTLARESYDPRLDALYERLRAPRGVRAIYRGLPGAAARIVRTLKGNGVLGVPMDLRSRVPSIDAPFLGRPARTAVGPARIALRTGAAVIVGTVAPTASGALAITTTHVASADLTPDAAGERILTERINAELSRRILALPDQWVWMHERFEAPLFG